MQKNNPQSFATYLRRRGYEPPWNSGASLKRWWFTSFAQPGFAQFWRLWNPPIGYLMQTLYRKLGGDQNRILACLGTFAICGFFHDVITFVCRGFEEMPLVLTFAFSLYGMLTLLTSRRSVLKRMRQIPWPIHVILNSCSLCLGLFAGDFFSDLLGTNIG